ncbi:Spy/CpxP family protein refolding chaperone [Plesiomonas shigelloides]|uniref:Spy/CpxP family protein refolding chaperone n=1 Tax=Plesiomonas shigelloides TaxID=703 RepID=UPI00387F1356
MRVLNKVMIASVVALTSTMAFAQGGQNDTMMMGKGMMDGGMMQKHHNGQGRGMRCAGFATKGLNLTEAQQKQFTELCTQLDRQPMMDAQMRTQMHAIMTAPKFDEAAARTMFEKMNTQRIEQQVQRAKVHNQMYNLLTPEQKAKVDQRFAARQPVATPAPAAAPATPVSN